MKQNFFFQDRGRQDITSTVWIFISLNDFEQNLENLLTKNDQILGNYYRTCLTHISNGPYLEHHHPLPQCLLPLEPCCRELRLNVQMNKTCYSFSFED